MTTHKFTQRDARGIAATATECANLSLRGDSSRAQGQFSELWDHCWGFGRSRKESLDLAEQFAAEARGLLVGGLDPDAVRDRLEQELGVRE